MSFILDALKKLEQKRQQNSIPDVMTLHNQPQDNSSRQPVWPYLILGALVLNVVILIGWIKPWQPERADTVRIKDDIKSVAAPSGESSPAEENILAKKTPAPDVPKQRERKRTAPPVPQMKTVPKPVLEQLPVPPDKGESAAVEQDSEQQAPSGILPSEEELSLLRSKIKQERFPDAASSSRTETHPDDTALRPHNIQDLGQLPAEIQKDLKDVSISGHIYSDQPAARIVTINGGLMHEGDSFAPGVKIDEITMSGIICTYRGYRFRIRAF